MSLETRKEAGALGRCRRTVQDTPGVSRPSRSNIESYRLISSPPQSSGGINRSHRHSSTYQGPGTVLCRETDERSRNSPKPVTAVRTPSAISRSLANTIRVAAQAAPTRPRATCTPGNSAGSSDRSAPGRQEPRPAVAGSSNRGAPGQRAPRPAVARHLIGTLQSGTHPEQQWQAHPIGELQLSSHPNQQWQNQSIKTSSPAVPWEKQPTAPMQALAVE